MSDASQTFANDPLVNLLRLRKDKPVMTDEERRVAVMQLRELRTSPQALGRTLRKRASEDVEDAEPTTEILNETGISLDGTRSAARKKKPASEKKVETASDLYKSLGL